MKNPALKNENMNFILTPEQARIICKHFGKDIEEMQEYEIMELLDGIIDNLD